jgi:hypothetical protein
VNKIDNAPYSHLLKALRGVGAPEDCSNGDIHIERANDYLIKNNMQVDFKISYSTD